MRSIWQPTRLLPDNAIENRSWPVNSEIFIAGKEQDQWHSLRLRDPCDELNEAPTVDSETLSTSDLLNAHVLMGTKPVNMSIFESVSYPHAGLKRHSDCSLASSWGRTRPAERRVDHPIHTVRVVA